MIFRNRVCANIYYKECNYLKQNGYALIVPHARIKEHVEQLHMEFATVLKVMIRKLIALVRHFHYYWMKHSLKGKCFTKITNDELHF